MISSGSRTAGRDDEPPPDVTGAAGPTPAGTPGPAGPVKAFTFGFGLMIVGMPGALPYFAAVDQILRADPGATGMVVAISFYDLVFVAPLIAVIVLARALGEKGKEILARINRFFEVWGRRVTVILLVALGFILVADGIGWLMNAPLLPIP